MRWAAPAAGGGGATTSYFLYESKDGLSWDNGTSTSSATATVNVPVGQCATSASSAANGGGESFRHEQIVGAKSAASPSTVR